MKPSQAMLDAAARLIMTLGADERFVAEVANEEISRRVALGLLVPREKLEVVGGLELAPAGRLHAVETACRAVVERWLELGPEQGWTDEERLLSAAIKHLNGVLHPDDSDTVDDEPDDDVQPPADDDTPAAEPAADAHLRPEGMPAADYHGPCDRCSENIEDDEQALRSWILLRKKLCAPCHRIVAAGDTEPDAADTTAGDEPDPTEEG